MMNRARQETNNIIQEEEVLVKLYTECSVEVLHGSQ